MSERRFPWPLVAAISLGFNLAIGGALIGGYLAGARVTTPNAAAISKTERAPGLGRGFLEALAPESRAKVRREMGRAFLAAREERRAARRARETLARAAMADPYDPVAVREGFAALRAADAAVQARYHVALTDVMSTMTAAERRAALMALARQSRQRPKGGQGAQGGPPPEDGPSPRDAASPQPE